LHILNYIKIISVHKFETTQYFFISRTLYISCMRDFNARVSGIILRSTYHRNTPRRA